ncbi:bacteriocin fulvocin C-related protein [Aureispira anguillae]|uniref:Bacteriocin fulvocin C-related protein n=1 Tax=Aureispira anguillae TaxID=2864201 RepID=A0A916DTU1_9BACT|nr:bacteriocin fulvocin C-related protein [Aureispira anguillae]BDS12786.1 bacteriocin fulvocin C-related protein [Aureispira anguillae]
MKKLFLASIALLLSIAIIVSCKKTEAEVVQEEIQEQTNTSFRNNEEYTPIPKAEYLKLSTSTQKGQWLSKLNYLLNTQGLNNQQRPLVEHLIENIVAQPNDIFKFNEDIQETSLLLVQVFSKVDFINSFASLDANTLTGANTPICEECTAHLVGGNNSIGGGLSPAGLSDCNCDWSCGDDLASSNCRNPNCCEPTSSGCGFLWLFPCDGLDTL